MERKRLNGASWRRVAMRDTPRCGLSLLELLVVMLILIAVSIIAVPWLTVQVETPSGKKMSPDEIVTQSTLKVVQAAIAGEDGVIENLAHAPNAIPRKISELLSDKAPDHIEREVPQLRTYDPVIRIGWRGPYLIPTGQSKSGEPAIVDAWGNELELQVDFNEDGVVDREESLYMRIVSGGPNGTVETPVDIHNMKPGANSERELTRDKCGDDLVMFVQVPDERQ
jgi:hypothetical protein